MSRKIRFAEPVRSVLSNSEYSTAKSKLDSWRRRMFQLQVAPPCSALAFVERLFTAEDIAFARHARDVLDTSGQVCSYMPDETGLPGNMTIYFNKLGMSAIARKRADWRQLVLHQDLNVMFTDIRTLHNRFAEARNVLDYINGTTPAAARYYFPAIKSLVNTQNIPHELPSRYADPIDIMGWLPKIRAASTLVAECLLMPENDDAKGDLVVNLSYQHLSEGYGYPVFRT